MNKLSLLIFVAAVLISGAGSMTARFIVRRSQPRTKTFFLGPPCRGGLVSVNAQTDSPVQLTITDTACDHNQFVTVNYVAANISSLPVTQFQISGIETYDDVVAQTSGVIEMGTLQPDQTRSGFIGGDVITVACGKPVGRLRQFQLAVSAVTFAGGKTWFRDLPHNKSLDASRDRALCMKLL